MQVTIFKSRVSGWWGRSAIALLSAGLLTMTEPSMAGAENEALVEFQQHIRAKYDIKEAAFAANDPVPILSRFYSPNVMSTGPDGKTHFGRDELYPIYQEVIGGDVRVESYRSFVNGDAGWDWVNFYVTPPKESGQAPITFKMLFLWERIDGEWWSHGEMFVVGEFDIE